MGYLMTRMPKYEKIRNRMHRQTAISEKPEKGRLLAIVNSAFFLWLMTAIFLTIGGTYFTTVQKCMADAESAIYQWEMADSELSNRDYYFKYAVANAGSISNLKAAAELYKSVSSDYQTRDTFELEASQHRILRKASAAELEQLSDYYPMYLNEIVARAALQEGTDDALKRAKNVKIPERPDKANFFALKPNCRPSQIIAQLITGEQKIIAPTLLPVPVIPEIPGLRSVIPR